jgi:hypothetical protein
MGAAKTLSEVIADEAAHRKEAPRNPKTPPAEQFNNFCTEPPCASAACRKARRCLHHD